MAFKLTYTDGQEAEYGDDTAWEVDDGVLKMGRTDGDWTVLVSPSHWAVIEAGSAATRAEKSAGKDDKGEPDNEDSDDDESKADDSKDSDDDDKKD